jgi:hypothetical protein
MLIHPKPETAEDPPSSSSPQQQYGWTPPFSSSPLAELALAY